MRALKNGGGDLRDTLVIGTFDERNGVGQFAGNQEKVLGNSGRSCGRRYAQRHNQAQTQ